MKGSACRVSTTSDVVLVCIADDDRRQRVTATLREQWPVRTAQDDRTAGESLDEAVSVVVLDLDEAVEVEQVLDRRSEAGIAFETAGLVDGSPRRSDDRLDECLRKPVDAATLRATVDRLHRRVLYDRVLGRYYALADDYAEAVSGDHHETERVVRLKERLVATRARLDDIADGLDDVDAFDAALGGSGDGFDDFSLR